MSDPGKLTWADVEFAANYDYRRAFQRVRGMTNWRPIAELPEELKDGRPVLLWTSWKRAREKSPAAFGDWEDEPVTGRWRYPGGKPGPNGYWSLVQAGGYAEDDDVSGDITHFAEIEPPSATG